MRGISAARNFRSLGAVGRGIAEPHELRWQSSVAALALDQLCAGVILCDDSGRVIDMNRAAEFIIQFDEGLNVKKHRLCARRAFETGKIARLIAGATANAKSGAIAGRMLVGRSDGRPPYVLTVTPLHTDVAVDDQRFAMIVVVDPQRHSPSEKDLAEFFGLSPAETRLAVSLLTGQTLSQIATGTGVRITTLRTQLGSILRKVGAERQSDLIRILSSTGIGSVSLAAGWLDAALESLQIPLSLAGL